MSKFRHRLYIFALSLIMCVCAAVGISAFAAEENLNGYRYTLQFSDDFNGTVADGWSRIVGGSSYSYTADGQTIRGWRFGGENHIAYKTSTTTDYGKFLYGSTDSANYMFEVKVKADVPEENLQQYLDDNAANLGAGMTINTMIPFFVTDPQPDANAHEFRGRGICFNNYAIGFYEKGVKEDGSLNGGWAVQPVRINAKLDATKFSWRDWHTLRVEATDEYCRLWMDDVLLLETPQSSFTRSPQTSGYCGFAGVCGATYSPLHYDDFRFWTSNPDYDDTVMQDVTVNAIDATDFTDASKVDYYGSSLAKNMHADPETNTAVYNDEPGTEVRLLNEYAYGDFEMTVGLDLENQKAAKGIEEGDTTTKNVRTSLESGLLFWTDGATGTGSNKTPNNGYMLSYMAYHTDPSGKYLNRVTLNIVPFVEGKVYSTTTSTPYKMVSIGAVSGTTSVVLDLIADSEAQTLTVTAYASKEDKENGTPAAGIDQKVIHLADTGCTFDEGYLGMRVNAGGTLNLIYEAQYMAFSAQSKAPYPANQPVEEKAMQTITVAAAQNGSVQYNGVAAEETFDVATHSNVPLTFVPDEGYIVDNVKVNGVSLGAVGAFVLQNVTQAYSVEVTFTDVKTVDVFILAGQSNAAGFTPAAGLYKGYTYGGEVDQEKLAEYESGYTDILYYGITQSADPAAANAKLSFVRSGKGYSGAHIGPELGFAEAMSAYYGGENGKAAVIKYAVGATSLGNFQNSTSDTYGTWMSPSMIEEYGKDNLCPKAGLLYENLIVTLRLGLQELIAAGYKPVIKGAMWLQGEADSTNEALANLYQKHMTALIEDLRGDVTDLMTDLDVAQDCSSMPFVIGKIGANLQNANYEDVVRKQMQMTAAAMENVRCAESEDLLVPDPNDNNDVWHFSVKGILAMGNRFGEMLAQETDKKPQVIFEVTFDSAGGSTVAAQEVKQWLTAARPADPDREGYSFLGWYAGEAQDPFDFEGRSIAEDIALTAHWEAVEYSISYTLNGGAFADEVKESYTIEESFDLPVPGRSGFAFEGWYDNAELTGEAVESVAAGTTGNLSFFAKWEEQIVNYDVSVQQAENGTVEISPSGSVVAGTQITVTATPAAGYVLDAVLVNGEEIDGTSFFVRENSVVSARFIKDETVYSVTLASTQHGTAEVSATSAVSGTEIAVTVTPDEGYTLDNIFVNGEPITGNTFVLLKDSEVQVTFKLYINQYTVTVQSSEHGTVTVDKTTAFENAVITVTATPDEGYKVVTIKVNGEAIEGNTFVLSGDSVVTAEFAEDTDSAKSGCGGTVTASAAIAAVTLAAGAAVAVRRKRKG